MSENKRALLSLSIDDISNLIILLEGGERGILNGTERAIWIKRLRATETILTNEVPIHFTDLGTEP